MSDSVKMLYDSLQSGDTVVGTYNPLGGQIKQGGVMFDDKAKEQRNALIRSMSMSGGELVASPAKVKAVKKTVKKTAKKKEAKRSRTEEDNFIDPPTLNPATTLAQLEETEFNIVAAPPSLMSVVNPVADTSRPLRTVSIYNDFGQIRLSVEDILEGPLAIMLVFRHDKDLIFIPKAGQTLNLELDDTRALQVYYPNALFDNYFLAPDRKFMVLFKVDEQPN